MIDPQTVEALIALGGNVGDVRATLDRAVKLFCEGDLVRLVARSCEYATPPWGETNQPAFVNACLLVETSLSPRALLDHALAVERLLGRDRTQERRWGPRSIDIDILSYGDVSLREHDLVLPHPRLFERAFVLVPLAEIVPDRVIAGQRIRDALAKVDRHGIKRLG